MAIVSAKSISKFYGKKKVLDNISLEVNRGEIFGLLGSNAAGKSTLTKIFLGLEKPSKGKTTILSAEETKKVKQKIGLVPQEPSFYFDFSVEKNLQFFASIFGLKGKTAKKRIEFLLSWLSLEEFRKEKTEHLSGGYQRLLNIAISIIHDPELIFMDEPTVGLDPKMRQILWEKIEELKEAEKTIILTTHYMDEAEVLCSRIALLKKGKLITTGHPSTLIREHGGVRIIILQIEGSTSPEDVEKIKKDPDYKGVFVKGDRLFIPLKQKQSINKMVTIIEWLNTKGYKIISSMIKEPDLEDVFLNLTGEKMSEGNKNEAD